jgi:hexokinase
MDAIINDGSATLLSSAYNDPTTRFGFILGTGTNASVMLPCSAIHPSKFGERPAAWHAQAKEVLVNTEYSMFGKGALSPTRWDAIINSTHSQPDFQPYEQLIGGGYMGEILRLMLVDAIQEAGLLGGIVPAGLRTPYSIDTGVLAALEGAEPDYTPLLAYLSLPPSPQALKHIRTLVALISHRACALLATAIHAMWQLRVSSLPVSATKPPPASIACNGSVIERYPGFMTKTQQYLDKLVSDSGVQPGSVVLEIAVESALYGAAVAVGSLEGLHVEDAITGSSEHDAF